MLNNGKTHSISFGVLIVLESLCLASLGVCIARRRTVLALTCVANILLMLLASGAGRWLGLRFSELLLVLLYLFIFCSIMVGTVWDVYYRTGNFDMFMHGAAGFLFAGIGYGLFSAFHRDASLQPNPVYLIIVAVSFSLALSLLWELFEAGMMFAFGMDMQRDAVLSTVATSYFTNQDAVSDVLHVTSTTITGDFGMRTIPGYWDMGYVDTITDMLVETGGALVFGALALVKKGRYIRAFVPEVKQAA